MIGLRTLLVAGVSVLVAIAAPASASGAPGAPVATPCPSLKGAAELPLGTRCLTVPAPLDHSGRVPGTVNVAVARVAALRAKTGTLMILSGGPGQAAVPLAGPLTELLREAREHHDLVYVDQRGSGASDPVTCPPPSTAAQLKVCLDALGARRPFWTTRETALDLEDVRVALGDEKLTLYGVSYGGRLAGEYARRFPARTAGLVLDSPAPVDGLDTSLALRQLGLPRVLREVCFPPDCSAFVRDPAAALAALVRKLRGGPLRGRVVLPSGLTRSAALTADSLYGLVLRSDLDPVLRRASRRDRLGNPRRCRAVAATARGRGPRGSRSRG